MTEQPKRKIPKWALIGGGALAVLLVLAGLGSGSSDGIDLSVETCESLIPRVIEASKGKESEVLEITNPSGGNGGSHTEPKLVCTGRAEWSEGYGGISYGAYRSEGGSIMVHYQRQ